MIDGKGWRSGAKVERRLLNQWFLKITKFSNELLTDLNLLDKWPENVKVMQKNWIGKSVGAEIQFKIIYKQKTQETERKEINVYTTRPDTVYGASFLAIAPDHELSILLS